MLTKRRVERRLGVFHADDDILLPNHRAPVSGRKALDEYTVEHAKGLPVFEKLDLRTDKIDDLGEYVVEYSSADVNWRMGDSSGVAAGGEWGAADLEGDRDV